MCERLKASLKPPHDWSALGHEPCCGPCYDPQSAFQTTVSAAKMGLTGLARGLATEFAPDNIRVNVVSPGRIDTTRDLSWYSQGGMSYSSDIPLGRLGTSKEIAAACLFLITDDCGFITGQTIHVNGGTALY